MGLFGSPDLSNKKEKPNKPKKPFYKRWWFIVIVMLFIIGALGDSENNDNETSTEIVSKTTDIDKEIEKRKKEEEKQKKKEEEEKMKLEQALKDKEEFIESAQEYNYSDIERKPDEYKGKAAVFKGKVIQVTEVVLNTVVYRVATQGEFDDIVYVTYKRPEGESRVLEDDIVEVYGDLDGVTTYTSVLGGNITIPSIKARYIIIKE